MLNHIELAKECGADAKYSITPSNVNPKVYLTKIIMNSDQLAAYTNAVIEMCAEQACNGLDGYEIQQAILALKVKG